MRIFTLIGGIVFLMITIGILIQNVVITYKTNLNITICNPLPVAIICSMSLGITIFCFAVSYYYEERVDFPNEIRRY